MKKQLRYFQQDCVDSIIESLKNKTSVPYANCVTGFGKSVVMADLTERALQKNRRVLQLVPNHTLAEQNYNQTFSYITDKRALGICSAKLSKFQIHKQAVIATQTSFLRRRNQAGKFDVLLVDECDMVSPNEKTTYQQIIASLLAINPVMRIVGMTGSPYRADQGLIHDEVKEGKRIFSECCYESDISRLMKEGYLSTVKILNTHVAVDLNGVKKKGNDYDQYECGLKFDKIITDAVVDFKKLFEDNGIKTALIFASTVSNGQRIVDEYGNDSECRLAHGELSNHARNKLITWLKEGQGKRYLVNVGLYNRGFDFPALEALVLLRATMSLRLYVQIIGRLIRSHDEKDHGYLCDYGTNVERFGPLDNLTPPKPPGKGDAPMKMCLECYELVRLSAKFCVCGAEFISDNETGRYSMKSKAEILRQKEENKKIDCEVREVEYMLCQSRKDGTDMIKIKFFDNDFNLICEKYLMLNHTGFPKEDSNRFLLSMFKRPADFYKLGTVGINVDNIYKLLTEYPDFFKKFKRIWVKHEGRFNKVVRVEYD
jgi:DNA repair protein RadD